MRVSADGMDMRLASEFQEAARALRELEDAAGDGDGCGGHGEGLVGLMLLDGHELRIFEIGLCGLEGGEELDDDGDIVPAVVPDQENRDFDELQSMRNGQIGPALERRTCRLCANTCGLFG